ncbi:PD-(D/E)XK nuclease family protein [Saccharicrinis aurantiacus]|uniref:PDDEXK-like family protein n=1 Tax=Saccharicrinis aurantiacus TaxID=1849719 RepID=UPI0024939E93|nr:PD-(D/E)XK nuclease family protein [Saccharicrinis aurantiacus]
MEHLIKQLFIICKEYQMLADREEKFNIFSALHKDHDERRLHSRFISVLLQPKGTHGLEHKFIELFLKELNHSGIVMDTNTSDKDSEIEESIEERTNAPLHQFKLSANTLVYPTEEDKKENNNIDILIIDRKLKQCVIIENKIYAGDSNGGGGKQLERYIDHVVTKELIPLDNIAVVYLTLDGYEPSKNSVGKYYAKKDIILCSYQHLIISWLEQCLTLTSRAPFLRESIVQYIKLIKKMTIDNTSEEERIAYRNLIGESNENMTATYKFIQNFKHVKWHAVNDFWTRLSSKITESGYTITKGFTENKRSKHVIAELTHFEVYRKGQKEKQRCYLNFKTHNGIEISIRFTDYTKFHFGIDSSNELNETQKITIEQLLSKKSLFSKGQKMPLYKKFDKDIHFNDFNQPLAFDLIDKVKNKQYVEDTWEEVKGLINEL